MPLRQFLDRPSGTLSYLLAAPCNGAALMIDPVLEHLPLYLAVIDEMGWRLGMILETHLHADHLSGATALRQATGAQIGVARTAGIEGADRLLEDGDQIPLGDTTLEVMATPGHTNACLTYRWQDRLFTGDCLLIGDCGPTDTPDSSAALLYDTIARKLRPLPDETLLYPGHDWQGRQISCLGEERRHNPLFHAASRDEFIRLAQQRPTLAGRCAPQDQFRAANGRCAQRTEQHHKH